MIHSVSDTKESRTVERFKLKVTYNDRLFAKLPFRWIQADFLNGNVNSVKPLRGS